MKIDHSRYRPTYAALMLRESGVYVSPNQLNRWTRLRLIPSSDIIQATSSPEQQQDYLDRVFILNGIRRKSFQSSTYLHVLRFLLGRVDERSRLGVVNLWLGELNRFLPALNYFQPIEWSSSFDAYRRAGWTAINLTGEQNRAHEACVQLPELDPRLVALACQKLPNEFRQNLDESAQYLVQHQPHLALKMNEGKLDIEATVENLNRFAKRLTLQWLRDNFDFVVNDELVFQMKYPGKRFEDLVFHLQERMIEISKEFSAGENRT